ncbi:MULTISPECIES: 2-hydroxymuconate tautomerase [unclassified Acidovorax]|uniref:2-hydroxymuconate tautomerase n=1 Tax=unclassified Acidovorax TaxID=2684926 RepID=UPI001C4556FD|nr:MULTISPECIES: 2-hydroxymuconate tautomerase [unclassified Acidovorax]MBV7427369.1 tautomerase family protein [Acidovorax sp. sif0732]MBV7448493.1 tautomerase family protein [Acidovorax sp. sif0715]
MPVIRIELSAGRTQEQKQQVVDDVTKSMVERCGCTPESVHVVFNDVSPSDWAVAGKFLGAPPQVN